MSVMSTETADPQTGPKYLKVPQVADELNVSVRTVYELLSAKQLKSIKIRGALRVPRDFLDEYIDGLCRDGA